MSVILACALQLAMSSRLDLKQTPNNPTNKTPHSIQDHLVHLLTRMKTDRSYVTNPTQKPKTKKNLLTLQMSKQTKIPQTTSHLPN